MTSGLSGPGKVATHLNRPSNLINTIKHRQTPKLVYNSIITNKSISHPTTGLESIHYNPRPTGTNINKTSAEVRSHQTSAPKGPQNVHLNHPSESTTNRRSLHTSNTRCRPTIPNKHNPTTRGAYNQVRPLYPLPFPIQNPTFTTKPILATPKLTPPAEFKNTSATRCRHRIFPRRCRRMRCRCCGRASAQRCRRCSRGS